MTDTLTASAAEAVPAPVPVRGGVAPYIMLPDAAGAAEFYKRALAAEEPGGRHAAENGAVIHLHLYVNGGSVMLMDPMPEYGHPLVPPAAISLHLQVDDADAWFARAVDAGCTVVMPVDLQFWGDRYGAVKDPFGVDWSFGSTSR